MTTPHPARPLAALLAAAVTLAAAAPALAAAYIKFDGVDGEVRAVPNLTSPGGTAPARGHEGSKGWIEIQSVQFAPPAAASGTLAAPTAPSTTRMGGVHVATGDLDGDGAPSAAGLRKTGPGTLVLSGALAGCRVGTRYPAAQVRTSATARVQTLQDVTVAGCTATSMTLNYSKITF